ncbi:MAG: hypothetical protein ACYDD1_14930 [Caulobacteraceae bacterium]
MTDAPYTYLLKIEGVHPPELPLARFLEYIEAIGALLGVGAGAHLVGIRDESAGAAIFIDPPAVPKAERRVSDAILGLGPKRFVGSFRRLEGLAQNDNLPVRLVRFDGSEVFHIAVLPQQEAEIGPIRQQGFLQGHVTGVVGSDDTKHIRLQDGTKTYSGIEAKKDLAAKLGHHLFVPTVRLSGSGFWTRRPGAGWQLDRFVATDFEILDDRPLLDVVADLRAVGASEWGRAPDPWRELERIRSGE